MASVKADKPGIVKRVEALEALPEALPVDGTAVNALKWNGSNRTISAAGPSGGADNDVWLQYL